MNILLTGSSGFIGKHLKKNLVKNKNYSVFELNSDWGDIALKRIKFKKISHVIHLAAKSFVPESWEDPYIFYRTNVLGAANVLEFCRKNECDLTAISSYIYGKPINLPIDEKLPKRPYNPYSHSKILSEEMYKFYQKNFGLRVNILRPFNIYGPGQKEKFIIPKIIKQVLDNKHKSVELLDLKPKRDFLYIDDFIEAIIKTIEENNGATYNVGSGTSISVKNIVEIIMKTAGIKKEIIESGLARQNEIMDVVADIRKIKNELNWHPKINFEKGIAKCINFYKKVWQRPKESAVYLFL
jgi:nucleoside-diphosphate-sugar epimerase